MTKSTKGKKKADSERARKEAWLARSRQPGAAVGDTPMMNADDHSRLPLTPLAGSRIGDS